MDATAKIPEVLVLGEVEVVGARGEHPMCARLCREAVVYLAMCRGRGRESFTEAVMTGRRGDMGRVRRNALMLDARRWLGSDDEGRSFIPPVVEDRYVLDERVRTDWDWFMQARGRDMRSASLPQLVSALRHVRGRPFSGIEPGRWEWAVPFEAEISLEVAETAREVAERAQEAGRWEMSRWAAEVGLVVSPLDEGLWQTATVAARRCQGAQAAQQVRDRAMALRKAIA